MHEAIDGMESNGLRVFNIYLEHIVHDAIDGMESNGSRVRGRTINNLRFADDIGRVAELLDQAQLLLDRVLDQVSSKYGQQEISETNTEWMLFSMKSEQIVRNRKKDNTQRKKTIQKSFKYLGSNMTTNCNCSADIRVRTGKSH